MVERKDVGLDEKREELERQKEIEGLPKPHYHRYIKEEIKSEGDGKEEVMKDRRKGTTNATTTHTFSRVPPHPRLFPSLLRLSPDVALLGSKQPDNAGPSISQSASGRHRGETCDSTLCPALPDAPLR